MYISKKDLLAMTGISYGQLYRWKRERLIPEEWFIKQASFTGQETFFPREQILSRIRSILELKDKYSLEELAKLLSPEVAKSAYSQDELEDVEEVDQDLWNLFQDVIQRDTYEYADILIILLASEIRRECKLNQDQLKQMIKTFLAGNLLGKILEMSVYLIQIKEQFYTIMVKEDQNPVFDDRMKVVYKRNVREIASEVKMRYKEKFR